jgi:hypothetical protein
MADNFAQIDRCHWFVSEDAAHLFAIRLTENESQQERRRRERQPSFALGLAPPFGEKRIY